LKSRLQTYTSSYGCSWAQRFKRKNPPEQGFTRLKRILDSARSARWYSIGRRKEDMPALPQAVRIVVERGKLLLVKWSENKPSRKAGDQNQLTQITSVQFAPLQVCKTLWGGLRNDEPEQKTKKCGPACTSRED